MMNIMRADLYRIFRGKGIYVTLVVFFVLMGLRIFANGTVGIGVVITESDGSNTYDVVEALVYTGINAPYMTMSDGGTFLYFILPLVVLIATTDFSHGAAKNILASGTSRSKYYLSKLILSCAFCAILYLINITVSTVVATVANGFGGTFDVHFLISVLKPIGMQLLLCIAATCVGLFITFTSKSTGAMNGFYIAWLFVPMMTIMILMDIVDISSELIFYDITIASQSLADFDMLKTQDILRTFALGAFYIIGGIAGGLALFKRAEIK